MIALQHNHSQEETREDTCEACFWEIRKSKPGFTTYSGRWVNMFDIQPSDIYIEDIAHHLACINRWCGALREPISVAQHSVYVSWLVDGTGYELEGLLHDATEAYLGDVTKWLKSSAAFAGYREIEDQVALQIAAKFGICPEMPDEVERADRMMINVEGAFGFSQWRTMPGFPVPTPGDLQILRRIDSWSWQKAEEFFLARFKQLIQRRSYDLSV